ncbi:hypothetical protein, partial [Phascolarctobacterium succinatutens]
EFWNQAKELERKGDL